MSFGIIEIISLLLGLSGFGLQANPKAPSADQSLEYAIADADVVSYVDATSLIPGNFKVLTQLAEQPQIKSSPELAKLVRQAVTEVESARGLAKTMTGIDPTTDIADATAFIQITQVKAKPNLVLAVHGRFSTANVDKISKMTGATAIKAGAGTWTDIGDGNVVAVTRTGVLLLGTAALVKARLEASWKAPSHATGTNLGYAAEMFAAKPVFATVLTMSQAARTAALDGIGGQNFATDILKRHKLAAFAVYHDGLGWSWVDSSKAGLEAMAEVSDGTVDLLRAAQIAPRGFAKIVLGGLESYRSGDQRIELMLQHKADLMKLVDSYIGDGSFKAQVDKDPKSLRLNVRLTGKSLSEVLPLGCLVPFAAGGAYWATRATISNPDMQISAPPMPPSPTKKKP